MLLGYFCCSITKFFHRSVGPQRIAGGCPKSYERPIVPGMFQSDGKLMMVQAQTNCILPFPNRVSPFLAWGDFHARSRLARSTISEEKWGTTRSLVISTNKKYL